MVAIDCAKARSKWLLADFYVIATGQHWGNVATIVGIAATLLAVCIVLLSGTIRVGFPLRRTLLVLSLNFWSLPITQPDTISIRPDCVQ